MIIGIDISQLAYSGGVANYLENLVENLIKMDTRNRYVLFGSSLRNTSKFIELKNKYKDNKNALVVIKKLPPSLLDILWNKLHVLPIEKFIGNVDIFITSDWTSPPVKHAKIVNILYDLLIYKHPKEMDSKIINTQSNKLKWTKREADLIFAISESTKKDAIEILGLSPNKIKVIYPGFSL